MKRVYIAGPMSSSGNYIDNIRNAVSIAEEVYELGLCPYVPHLQAMWQLISPHHEYGYWIPMDLEWLGTCSFLLRLPGESHGADLEADFALSHGIPVVCSLQELKDMLGINKDLLSNNKCYCWGDK